ncbi:TPA: hypothetical protein NJ373_004484 [Vibrio parahaemolyticus]|uniref:hypothetical protein n=1 Tax=Vibrio parahaemolyticus TaxID=670 RepID=UPI001A29F4E0|nr:hypothetical protein [Vibrio parahaemolyticus]EGQ7688422.1 hypothetical protein [Vibrio parahaemolyticus]EGQ8186731.1 hypothetical protein [Vibrio parahaemolyticus]EGQ8546340.1 hypothetical protein [Vibrio parahaemolyticus]EKQ5826211.1 hypothetical protein [Vibrio parahaemolyticus]HCE1787977.1 hypothetical protein [Vibrio parahaemolyticus]
MDSNTVVGLILGALISYIIPKISPYIDGKLKKLGDAVRDKCFDPIKGFFRKRRLRKLKHLRITRRNSSAVTFQIVSAHVYFFVVLGSYFLLCPLINPSRLRETV